MDVRAAIFTAAGTRAFMGGADLDAYGYTTGEEPPGEVQPEESRAAGDRPDHRARLSTRAVSWGLTPGHRREGQPGCADLEAAWLNHAPVWLLGACLGV